MQNFFGLFSACRHQAGWFPFNLDNELQLPGDRAHQDDLDGDVQNHDLQEMVAPSLPETKLNKLQIFSKKVNFLNFALKKTKNLEEEKCEEFMFSCNLVNDLFHD